MLTAILTIGIFASCLLGFTMLMGYRKGNSTLDLDERFTNQTEQSQAVIRELESQGNTVEYRGNGQYVMDENRYTVHNRNVSMGGAALQRTVLVPVKL